MRWSLVPSHAPPRSAVRPRTTSPSGIFSTSAPRSSRSCRVVARRSLSLMRRRPALMKRVSPSAKAATTERTGTRSGIWGALTVMPRSAPGRTVTASSVMETSAPKASRSFTTARSPWRESARSPVSVTPLPRAPAQSQKALFDQSPSTSAAPGLLSRSSPSTVNLRPSSLRVILAPKSASTSSVMSM